MNGRLRVGILGGTFDPIHLGHLNLAMDVLEYHHLDEVWFCPVNLSPHKRETPPVSAEHRQAMIELAIANFPMLHLLPYELNRPGPSYTIDTLKEIETDHPNWDVHFIMGEDAVANFDRWHQPEEILKRAKIIVGARSQEGVKGRWEVTPTRIFQISSTTIRARLGKGITCRHLLPESVADYIEQEGLYVCGSGVSR